MESRGRSRWRSRCRSRWRGSRRNHLKARITSPVAAEWITLTRNQRGIWGSRRWRSRRSRRSMRRSRRRRAGGKEHEKEHL